VRENEISLRKWSGGTAQLRTLEEHCRAQCTHKRKWYRDRQSKWSISSNGEVLGMVL